jgi:hypothetical protein
LLDKEEDDDDDKFYPSFFNNSTFFFDTGTTYLKTTIQLSTAQLNTTLYRAQDVDDKHHPRGGNLKHEQNKLKFIIMGKGISSQI